jgi:hypothetical protein
VVPLNAHQNDPIRPVSAPGARYGWLRTWSRLDGAVTVDAALIWVDPAVASAEIEGLGPPVGINQSPAVGEEVRLYSPGGAVRTTWIESLNHTAYLSIPAWGQTEFPYVGQIRCQPGVSVPGDSGAMMFDTSGRVVGMLVGGLPSYGDVVTPISAILNYPGWNGRAQVVSAIPQGAATPPFS